MASSSSMKPNKFDAEHARLLKLSIDGSGEAWTMFEPVLLNDFGKEVKSGGSQCKLRCKRCARCLASCNPSRTFKEHFKHGTCQPERGWVLGPAPPPASRKRKASAPAPAPTGPVKFVLKYLVKFMNEHKLPLSTIDNLDLKCAFAVCGVNLPDSEKLMAMLPAVTEE